MVSSVIPTDNLNELLNDFEAHVWDSTFLKCFNGIHFNSHVSQISSVRLSLFLSLQVGIKDV